MSILEDNNIEEMLQFLKEQEDICHKYMQYIQDSRFLLEQIKEFEPPLKENPKVFDCYIKNMDKIGNIVRFDKDYVVMMYEKQPED